MNNLVSIDSIINSSYKHAGLCRDILRWCCKKADEKQYLKEFDVTELGNWLIRNHKPYVEEYSDSKSHTPMSARLHSKRTYIKDRIQDLVKANLIEIVGTRKCSKNSLDTHIFRFTVKGSFIAWLTEAQTQTERPARSKAINMAFILIITNLFLGNHSFSNFITAFFDKCSEDEKLLSRLIKQYEPLTSLIMDIDLRKTRQLFLAAGCLDLKIGKIFQQVFRSLDKETQKLLLFQFKMDVEYNDSHCLHYNPYFMMIALNKELVEHRKSDPVHEWELMRYENIQDYSRVTLLGFCNSCREAYPFQMDLFRFMNLHNTFTLKLGSNNHMSYNGQRINCIRCKKKNSLLIVQTWLSSNEGKDIAIIV